MKYRKSEAKDYARQHIFKGVWCASVTPYTSDYKIDYEGWRHDLHHIIDNLGMDGIFVNGLMGEGFHHTIDERKEIFKIAVEESKGKMLTMPYTSDPVLENVVNMTKYAEEIGADFAIVINPKFYFGAMSDEGVYQYYKYIADRTNLGIAIFNQMEHGYVMSPKSIAKCATIPNIVGTKNTSSFADRQETQRLCGDKIVVAALGEMEWFHNFTVYGVDAMIPNPGPYTLQSKKLRLIKDMHALAIKGETDKAWDAYKRLESINSILTKVTVPGKTQATYKYWCQFIGMSNSDGRVRLPQMELTAAEKKAIEAAVKSTDLV